MFAESGPTSYMREALALAIFRDAGVPCAETRYVRLFLNGTLRGLYLLTERLDSGALAIKILLQYRGADALPDWLASRGLSPNGSVLFEAKHYKYSNLRPPDTSLSCPQTTPDEVCPLSRCRS